MALKKELEEKLALVDDEAYRKTLTEAFEKYPDLAKGFLADAEFNRGMNRIKETELKQHAWWDKNGEPGIHARDAKIAELNANYQTIESAKSQLEAKVRELEASRASGDLSLGEDRAVVEELRGLKEAIGSIKAGMNSYVDEAKLEKVFAERGQNFANRLGTDLLDTMFVMRKHEKHFPDKELTKAEVNKLYGYAAENGIQDLDKAYDMMYGEEIRSNELKRIEAKHAEDLKQAEQRFASTSKMPPQPGPTVQVGPLQQRFATASEGASSYANMDEAIAAGVNNYREKQNGSQ